MNIDDLSYLRITVCLLAGAAVAAMMLMMGGLLWGNRYDTKGVPATDEPTIDESNGYYRVAFPDKYGRGPIYSDRYDTKQKAERFRDVFISCKGITNALPDVKVLTNVISLYNLFYGCAGATGVYPIITNLSREWVGYTNNSPVFTVTNLCFKYWWEER